MNKVSKELIRHVPFDMPEMPEDAGCKKGQGYLIGRPVPMDELEAKVRKYTV